MNSRELLRVCSYAVFVVALTSCDPCNNHILQEIPNPMGTRKAVVFHRACGALGGTSTHISILPTSAQHVIAGGNIFSANTNDGTASDVAHDGPPVVAIWAEPLSLYVAYDSRLHVIHAEKQINGVAISYEARSATSTPPALQPATRSTTEKSQRGEKTSSR